MFERQLASAKSIQTRLQSLTETVRVLDEAVSDPQVCILYFRCIPSKFIHAESTWAGLIPTLPRALTQHATLSQECSDAALTHDVFQDLLRHKAQFSTLHSLLQAGLLPEAARACETLQPLLDNAPSPLIGSKVMSDLKVCGIIFTYI
jgi:centromere/kinetochore protein ZW10